MNDPSIKKLEEKLGRPISSIPLKEVVSVDAGLVTDAVSRVVMRGAEDEAGYWREIISVRQMETEKEEIPLVTQRDFKVRTGHIDASGLEAAGGQFSRVSLDVSDEKTDHYLYCPIRERDIEMRRFDVVESALEAAGAAFAKHILSEITKAYVNDAGSTEALGTNTRFTALTNLIATMVDNGFSPDVCLMTAKDYAQVLQTEQSTGGAMPFITAIEAGPSAGENLIAGIGKMNGMVGRLFGVIPIYVIGNDSNLEGNIVLAEKAKGEVLGLHKDITVS